MSRSAELRNETSVSKNLPQAFVPVHPSNSISAPPLQHMGSAVAPIPGLAYPPVTMAYAPYQMQGYPSMSMSMPVCPPPAALDITAPSTSHGNDDADIDDPKGRIPIHGNNSNFNINSLLHQNILESDYFKALYQLRTYHEVIDEVYRRVTHVGPWQTGTSRVPSTGMNEFIFLLALYLFI
jgi:hypothetical protein